jgi:hypothetical protein
MLPLPLYTHPHAHNIRMRSKIHFRSFAFRMSIVRGNWGVVIGQVVQHRLIVINLNSTLLLAGRTYRRTPSDVAPSRGLCGFRT